jgi:hypothetical protein
MDGGAASQHRHLRMGGVRSSLRQFHDRFTVQFVNQRLRVRVRVMVRVRVRVYRTVP